MSVSHACDAVNRPSWTMGPQRAAITGAALYLFIKSPPLEKKKKTHFHVLIEVFLMKLINRPNLNSRTGNLTLNAVMPLEEEEVDNFHAIGEMMPLIFCCVCLPQSDEMTEFRGGECSCDIRCSITNNPERKGHDLRLHSIGWVPLVCVWCLSTQTYSIHLCV